MPALEEGKVQQAVFVAHLGFGIFHQRFEISLLLVSIAHPLRILAQLAGVKGAAKDIFQNDGVRNAEGMRVLHGRPQLAAANMLVAFKADLPDFDFGPFLHHKSHAHRRRRNRPHFRADRGELVTVLAFQLFQRDLGLLHLGGIVLALHAQPDFAFLKAIEHVALGDGVEPFILDRANGGLFFDVNMDGPALGALFALNADVFKISGVPQRAEVALDSGCIVGIAWAGKDSGADGLRRYAAVAVNGDFLNEIALLPPGAKAKPTDAGRQRHRPQQAALRKVWYPAAPGIPRACRMLPLRVRNRKTSRA